MTLIEINAEIYNRLKAICPTFPIVEPTSTQKLPFAVYSIDSATDFNKDGARSTDFTIKVLETTYEKMLSKTDSILSAFGDCTSRKVQTGVLQGSQGYIGIINLSINL